MYCTRSHLLACIYIRFLVIYHTSNKLHLTKLTTTYSSYTPTGRLKFTYMQSGTFLDHGSNLVRLHFPGMMKLLACQNSATKIRDVQRSKLRNEKMTTYQHTFNSMSCTVYTQRKAKAFKLWPVQTQQKTTLGKYSSLVMFGYSPFRNSGCQMLRSLCFRRCSSLRKYSIVLLMPCNIGTLKAQHQLSTNMQLH